MMLEKHISTSYHSGPHGLADEHRCPLKLHHGRQCVSALGSGASQHQARGIPIKEMRTDSFTELDLYDKEIGVVGGMAY
jgi:hypothetical protein